MYRCPVKDDVCLSHWLFALAQITSRPQFSLGADAGLLILLLLLEPSNFAEKHTMRQPAIRDPLRLMCEGPFQPSRCCILETHLFQGSFETNNGVINDATKLRQRLSEALYRLPKTREQRWRAENGKSGVCSFTVYLNCKSIGASANADTGTLELVPLLPPIQLNFPTWPSGVLRYPTA